MNTLGWTTTVPDLRTAIASPALFGQLAASAAEAADVVVGHSGAGAFLPAVAEVMNAAVVFVDAVVPPSEACFNPSAQLVQFLDTLPIVDGLLPPWHEWWSADVMADLVPDMTLRRQVIAEIPRVPRSFYDEAVPVPAQWWRRPAAFVQLSPAYADDRIQAEEWNWPTTQLGGRHLDLYVLPEVIASHLIDLIRQLHRRAH